MSPGRIKKFLKRRSFWLVGYAVYLALILLSVNALYAEVAVDKIRDGMDDEYTYHLTFRHDGVTTHYDVTRHDTSKAGKIQLTYQTQANKLVVSKVENIKTIEIDVNSLFNDEAAKVFKYNPSEISGMDMDYWLEAGDGIFTVQFNIDGSEPIESMTFTKFPPPTSVLVDNEEWWTTDINYTVKGNSITIDGIPSGKQTVVIIDWNVANKLPIPYFTMDPARDADVKEVVAFDGSGSSDPDGKIITWIWDFGDNITESGADKKTTTHAYSSPGTYTVRLTVRDDHVPYGLAWLEKTLKVSYGADQDMDNDSLPDRWEWANFNDITSQNADTDADSDTYPNGLEYLADTDPTDDTSFDEDHDADTLQDKWEWQYFKDIDETAAGDPDDDGASNAEEQTAGTDPTDATSKPEKSEEKDDSLLGVGKVGPVDIIVILMIVIVVVVITMVIMIFLRERKEKETKKEAEAERQAEIARQPLIPPSMMRPPPVPAAAPPPTMHPMPGAPAEEVAPLEYEPVLVEGTVVIHCFVCGEPVEVGTPNCPVCDAEM